jgi:hypothetical protein
VSAGWASLFLWKPNSREEGVALPDSGAARLGACTIHTSPFDSSNPSYVSTLAA